MALLREGAPDGEEGFGSLGMATSLEQALCLAQPRTKAERVHRPLQERSRGGGALGVPRVLVDGLLK